nr:MAG TPA: hypothetical protein [Caudoviricetes sp.]
MSINRLLIVMEHHHKVLALQTYSLFLNFKRNCAYFHQNSGK